MLKRLFKSKKAQNTAEYAILISLVVAGIVAMQTYAQRALQARVKDASGLMTAQTGTKDGTGANIALSQQWSTVTGGNNIETSQQYEPYYLSQEYKVERSDEETKSYVGNQDFNIASSSSRNRTGEQVTLGYDPTNPGTGTTDPGAQPVEEDPGVIE